MLRFFTARYDSLRGCGEVDDELKRMTWFQAGIPRLVFIHSCLYNINSMVSLEIKKYSRLLPNLSVDIFEL